MSKQLVLKASIGVAVILVAVGSLMVPVEAIAGLAEVPGGVVYGGGRPGGDPQYAGGAQAFDQPTVEIWTDRTMGSVYSAGERVNVYMRPEYDCYVMVYDIDTDGNLRLLFPYDSRDDGFVRGGQIYRLGMSSYGGYYVTGPSGVEYVHVLASFEPFRPLYWHGQAGYAAYAHDCTWRGFSDYWGSALPARVYGDPYVAMQSIDEFICYDALEAGIAFADFTYFYVEHRVGYPRYLCYDCHGYRPAFHPYVDACVGFHITFVACDPCYKPCSWWWWCSPKRVYCGPSYVCYSNKACNVPSKNPRPNYRWRSRTETFCDSGPGKSGTSYGDYYRERVSPRGGQSDGGRSAEVVRVRPERDSRPDGTAEERYLYSRKTSRDVVRDPAGTRSGEEVGGRQAVRAETVRSETDRTEAVRSETDRTETGRAETGRAEIRQVPSRAVRSETGSRRVEVPKVETNKTERKSGWSRLMNVVRETIERKTSGQSGSRVTRDGSSGSSGKSGTTRASDAKSKKSDSQKRTSAASSQSKVSSSRSASKARTESKSASQSTRRRVSD
jgi:hypothetical protein